jgi:hypothetical protein
MSGDGPSAPRVYPCGPYTASVASSANASVPNGRVSTTAHGSTIASPETGAQTVTVAVPFVAPKRNPTSPTVGSRPVNALARSACASLSFQSVSKRSRSVAFERSYSRFS